METKRKIPTAEIAAPVLNLFPKLDQCPQRIAIEIFRQLAEGLPVPRSAVADRLNLSREAVEAFLKSSTEIYFDDSDRIVSYAGLTLRKTAHRFTVNGQSLYTWCAWDSLFIPEILNRIARVESSCPVTRARISLTVGPQCIVDAEPSGAVISMAIPEAAKVRANVIANFCHFVHFFASATAGAHWASEHQGAFILDLEEAYALGRMYNEKQFGEALR